MLNCNVMKNLRKEGGKLLYRILMIVI